MQANTHAAVGVTIGLAVSFGQPSDMMLLAVTSAFVGSIICDIDVGETGKRSTPLILSAVSSLAVIFFSIFGYVFDTNTMMLWKKESGYLRSIIGITLFIGLCIYGSRKPHRSFMHSLLGMLLLGGGVYLIFPTASFYFLMGYVSHLILDIFNYRPVKLFYPIEKGYSLKRCYSKSRVNSIIFCAACALIACIIILKFVVGSNGI
ncbi:metal-dependent hydrolase [Pseudobutyrivibrio xylanivorans]|uniref:Metal-dependent hydrolase n=1 Tax=Pseudobutyrivibrio xylanivorans TaxID=185007 RepID=A0A5P6VNU0_PSEXY|nr:metal-dependent hydrolase [Pseudobutyrivibrio xylanivorans]QFJ54237.1 metal-dependent hydrolase [Pseudobutyrivibrio xylanivorans]